jgi:hypothetical protein
MALKRSGSAGGQRACWTPAVKREPEIVFDSGDGGGGSFEVGFLLNP